MVHYCLEAAAALESEGISVEVIDLRTLRPLDSDAILESVKKTPISFPSYEEQEQIINFLEKQTTQFDELIAKYDIDMNSDIEIIPLGIFNYTISPVNTNKIFIRNIEELKSKTY